jgi:hypothetical protein
VRSTVLGCATHSNFYTLQPPYSNLSAHMFHSASFMEMRDRAR